MGNGEWRRLHNEELDNIYRSPIIFRMIKSRSLRREGKVARMKKIGVLTKFKHLNLQEGCL